MLLLVLGMIDLSFMFMQRQTAQNGVEVLANLAAHDRTNSWKNTVGDENRRTNCNAQPLQPDISYPDGQPADKAYRQILTWRCRYQSITGVLSNIPMTVSAGAVVTPLPTPTPTPTPEPTPEATP